jgi:hypothetical protein
VVFIFEALWLLPIAVVLFLWQKRAGWILLVIHITYTLLTGICSYVFLQLTFAHNGWNLPPGESILSVAFFGVTLYFVCTKKMRENFAVNKGHITLSVLLSIAMCIAGHYALINS